MVVYFAPLFVTSNELFFVSNLYTSSKSGLIESESVPILGPLYTSLGAVAFGSMKFDSVSTASAKPRPGWLMISSFFVNPFSFRVFLMVLS